MTLSIWLSAGLGGEGGSGKLFPIPGSALDRPGRSSNNAEVAGPVAKTRNGRQVGETSGKPIWRAGVGSEFRDQRKGLS
jgi:hypothetical protein